MSIQLAHQASLRRPQVSDQHELDNLALGVSGLIIFPSLNDPLTHSAASSASHTRSTTPSSRSTSPSASTRTPPHTPPTATTPSSPSSVSPAPSSPASSSTGRAAGRTRWMRKKGEHYNVWKSRYFVLKGPHLYWLRSNSPSVRPLFLCHTFENTADALLCVCRR